MMSKVMAGLVFNGNTKTSRIQNAMLVLKGNMVTEVALECHPDKRHIKRYIKKIKIARALAIDKVRVTK